MKVILVRKLVCVEMLQSKSHHEENVDSCKYVMFNQNIFFTFYISCVFKHFIPLKYSLCLNFLKISTACSYIWCDPVTLSVTFHLGDNYCIILQDINMNQCSIIVDFAVSCVLAA